VIVELALATVASGLLAATGYALYRWMDARRRLQAELNAAERLGEDSDLKPPAVDSGLWGVVKQWWHNKRGAKLAKKGYVRWYKVGANWSRPRWVKPEKSGQGEYRLREGDEIYYFPTDAMLTDQRTGAWVAVHREGEATPVNLRDPGMPAMDADRAEELLQLSAESDAPGLLSDLDTTTIMWVGIGGILILAVGAQMTGFGG